MLSTYDTSLFQDHLTNNFYSLNTRRHKSNNHVLPTSIELSGLHVSEFRAAVPPSGIAAATIKTTQVQLESLLLESVELIASSGQPGHGCGAQH